MADINELYKASVRDAVFADEDEIYPLVTVAPDAEFVTGMKI